MASNPSFPEHNLPLDLVKLSLEQHGPVIRLAYMEIASGINRLLRRHIPKEVISQVLQQTVDALAEHARSTAGDEERY